MKKFTIPYANKFQEGEFWKRVQFMYAGELKRVKFEFSGPSLEAYTRQTTYSGSS